MENGNKINNEIDAMIKVMGMAVEMRNRTSIKRIMERDFDVPPSRTSVRLNSMMHNTKLVKKNKNGNYYLSPIGRERLKKIAPNIDEHAYVHSNKWNIRTEQETVQNNIMELLLMCGYDINYLTKEKNLLAEMGIGYDEKNVNVYTDTPKEILSATEYGDKRYITSRVIKKMLTSKNRHANIIDESSQASLLKGILFADRNIYYVYKEQPNKKWIKKNEQKILLNVEQEIRNIQSKNVYNERVNRGNLQNALVVVNNPAEAARIYKEKKYSDIYNEVYILDQTFVSPEKIMLILESANFTEDSVNLWLNQNIDIDKKVVNIELITQRLKNVTMIKDYIHTGSDIKLNIICLKTQGTKIKKYFTAKELTMVNIRELTTEEETAFLSYIANNQDYAIDLIQRLAVYENNKKIQQKNGIKVNEKKIHAEKTGGIKREKMLADARMERKVQRRIKKIEDELQIKITASWEYIKDDSENYE